MIKIILCRRPGKCCPTVKKTKNTVTITDDYGNKVKMTHGQFKLLQGASL